MFGEKNYKIGDLVINKLPIELTFDEYVIQPGVIVVVVSFAKYNDWIVDEYDYLVLIQGREVYFFDYELDPYEGEV